MLTRKSALTAAFALWIFALGVLLGTPTLVLASVPVVVYLVLIRITQPRPHTKFTIGRAIDTESVYEGQRATVTIKVRNDGPSVAALELLDSLPEGLRVASGSNLLVASLSRDQTVTFTYTVEPMMFGSYDIGPISLRTTDLGRNRVEERSLDLPATLWVYPEIRYMRRMGLRTRTPRNWPGETVARRSGSGIDYYGVKGYAAGDSLRRVNWKASSRSEEILINQYLDEAGGDVLLVLDSRTVSEVGNAPDSLLTHATRATAAIAYRMLRDRNRVGLIGIGSNLITVTPGFGRRQFEKMLASLVTLMPGDGWAIENLPTVLSLRFARPTLIVLVSPLLDDRSSEAVIKTSAAGFGVVVVSPSPLGFEVKREAPTMEETTATELFRLKRDVQLESLRRYAAVIDWDTSQPLGDALYRLAEARVR